VVVGAGVAVALAALAALLLYCTQPTILAHSALATLDMG